MTQNTPPGCYLTKKESDVVLHQMTWPPQSPDLNPIEMVWDELGHRVKEKQPTSAEHIWELLLLLEKMPRVCKAVIRAKGGYLKNLKYKIYFDLFNSFLATT